MLTKYKKLKKKKIKDRLSIYPLTNFWGIRTHFSFTKNVGNHLFKKSIFKIVYKIRKLVGPEVEDKLFKNQIQKCRKS